MTVLALELVPFAGIAFLWFIGVVRDRIGQREDRFFATVFLGSGLLFVALLFVASAVTAAFLGELAARTGSPKDVSGSAAGLALWSSTPTRCGWLPSSPSRRPRSGFVPASSRAGSRSPATR